MRLPVKKPKQLSKAKRSRFTDWRDSVPDRSVRPHRRDESGQLRPVKRTDSAANGRPRAVFVKTGRRSTSLKVGRLDLRSAAGRLYRDQYNALLEDLGGLPLTREREAHLDQAARSHVVSELAWSELAERGAFDASGGMSPALDAWLRAAALERAALARLDIGTRPKNETTLDEYLRSRGNGNGRGGTDS